MEDEDRWGDPLTEKEPWVIAGTRGGAEIWACKQSGRSWWWPVVFTELDCALIKIDVCGKTENWDLRECILRINNEVLIENEFIWDQDESNYKPYEA